MTTARQIEVTLNDVDITANINDVNITIDLASVGNVAYVNAGEKLYLNGNGSTTYITYNTTLSRLELWVDGALKKAWSN